MDRTRGIGGSDVGAILGVNRWKTGWDVWQDKMGRGEDVPDNPAMEWGRRLEDPVADAFGDATGALVDLHAPDYHSSDRYTWLGGHADRLFVMDGVEGVLEVKTAGAHLASEWGPSTAEFSSPVEAVESIPESYVCQLAYYMAAFERAIGAIAVLIGGRDFRYYIVHRDHEFEEDLLGRLDHWWSAHVVTGLPPEARTSEEADQQFPDVDPDSEAIQPDDEVLETLGRLRDVKQRIKDLTTTKKELEAKVKTALGPAPAMADHDGRVAVSWKERTSSRLDQRLLKELHPQAAADCTVTNSFRVLRVPNRTGA